MRPAILALAAAGCTLIVGDRHHPLADGGGGFDGFVSDGFADGGGGSCSVTSTFTPDSMFLLSGYDDAPMIADIGGQFAIAYLYQNQLMAITMTPGPLGARGATKGPVPLYTCQQQCKRPSVGRRHSDDTVLVFGVIDGVMPVGVITSRALDLPDPSPMPLTACGGSASDAEVMGGGVDLMMVAVCGSGDLDAVGSGITGEKMLQMGGVVQARAQGGSSPGFVAWATNTNDIEVASLTLGDGTLSQPIAVASGQGADGLAFDALTNETAARFLFAWVDGRDLRMMTALLTGQTNPAGTISNVEVATERAPLSVAAAPGTPARMMPYYLVAYTSIGASGPHAMVQQLDENGNSLGPATTVSTQIAHAPQVAFDVELDVAAMTFVGPRQGGSGSENALQIATLSCPH